MKGREIVKNTAAVLFYTALVIELLVVIIDKSELHNPYESLIFRLTFVLTFLSFLLEDHARRSWLLFIGAVVLGFFCYRATGRNEILRVVVFVAACGNRSRDRMLKTAFWITAAGCACIVLLSVTGIFGARGGMSTHNGYDVLYRYFFGFGHANSMHCMFYMLVLLALIVFEKKLRLWHYLLLFTANIGLYLLTDSRTGVGMAALTLIIAAAVRLKEAAEEKRNEAGKRRFRELRWPYAAGGAFVAACVLFSVWAAWVSYYLWAKTPDRTNWLRDYKYARKLDVALSTRITDLYWVLPEERADITTWTLFSSPQAQRYFDMGWCRLYYWYGIVPATLAVIALLFLIAHCAKKREIMTLIVILSASLYTVVEAHLVSVYIGRNFLFILMGAALGESLWLNGGGAFGLPAILKGKTE